MLDYEVKRVLISNINRLKFYVWKFGQSASSAVNSRRVCYLFVFESDLIL